MVTTMDIRNFFGNTNKNTKRRASATAIESSSKAKNKNDKGATQKQERTEVSAEHFFTNNSTKKKKITLEEEDEEEEEDLWKEEEEEEEVTPAKKHKSHVFLEEEEEEEEVCMKDITVSSPKEEPVDTTSTPASHKKRKGTPATSSSNKSKKQVKRTTAKATPTSKKELPPFPTGPLKDYKKDFYLNLCSSNSCLAGYTFVFTGTLPNLSREESQDIVKNLGGRVTTAVSSKTNYVVCGDTLEDGRPVQQGQKYIKAQQLQPNVQIVNGESWFFALIQLLLDSQPQTQTPSNNPTSTTSTPAVIPPPIIINPYAKKNPTTTTATTTTTIVNPYAKKKTPIKTEEKEELFNKSSTVGDTNASTMSNLWADKYAPHTSKDILGNGDCVRKLQQCK